MFFLSLKNQGNETLQNTNLDVYRNSGLQSQESGKRELLMVEKSS